MLRVRKAGERFHTRIDWLDSWHTFSFGEHYSPEHLGFRALRVVNEDRVSPGEGFPPHGHQDMEILSYVLDGALQHQDSLGNGSIIRPGDVQRMSAGTGVRHSEYNPDPAHPVHFLQIWIVPEARGAAPGYEQRSFDLDAGRNRLWVVASPDGREGSVTVHQDVVLRAARLDAGAAVEVPLASGRHGWVQVAKGAVTVDGHALRAGDGAAASEVSKLTLSATEPAEVLVFDLA